MKVKILPPDSLLEAEVALPPSKSVLARLMMLGAEVPQELCTCDDLRVLRAALPATEGTVDVEMSGTALRFLTARYAATLGCDIVLTGSERLLERPITPLVDALHEIGADITRLDDGSLRIRGRRLQGGPVKLDASKSSQFASALLLASPLMEKPVELEFIGEPASQSYLRLTEQMLSRPATLDTTVGDWSAAAFWYELAALSSGWVTLKGLDIKSLQPDAACQQLFTHLGVVTGEGDEPGAVELSASPDLTPRITLDLTDNPDLAQALTVTCCLLRTPFMFSGLGTLRMKECNRIDDLAAELARLGIVLTVEGDTISWEGAMMPIAEIPAFDAHGDHRMAMALAPVALYVPGITIDGAESVAKSYPAFWDDLRSAGFTVDEV